MSEWTSDEWINEWLSEGEMAMLIMITTICSKFIESLSYGFKFSDTNFKLLSAFIKFDLVKLNLKVFNQNQIWIFTKNFASHKILHSNNKWQGDCQLDKPKNFRICSWFWKFIKCLWASHKFSTNSSNLFALLCCSVDSAVKFLNIFNYVLVPFF